MASKTLQTRIKLKYDSYANWTSTAESGKGANLVLLAGELGICAVPAGSGETQGDRPQILFKVGDGSSAFSALPWTSGLSADVYTWAKKAKPGDAVSLNVTGDGNVFTSVSYKTNTSDGATIEFVKGITALTAESQSKDFGQVKVGDITITADQTADLLELVSGNAWIELTGDATNDKVTIQHKVGTISTTSGDAVFYKLAYDNAGHVTGVKAVEKADITALGIPAFNSTYTLESDASAANNDVKIHLKGVTGSETSDTNVNIVGAGGTTVTSDADGKITITSNNLADSVTTRDATLTADKIILGNASTDHAHDVKVSAVGISTDAPTSSSTDNEIPTSKAVATAIANLPKAMLFKGTVGEATAEVTPTITWNELPEAAEANTGHVYKVITDYAGSTKCPACKAGDLIVSNGAAWVVIPSGDEPKGTVTSVALESDNAGVEIASGSPITSAGTIHIKHGDTSSQASVTNTGRYYIQSVTLDDFGHVTKLESKEETVVDTDSYVNAAAFADDASGVKMTLTRTGDVAGTVEATIPTVSSSTAGVAPKGNSVATGSEADAKYLREDGTWVKPSYDANVPVKVLKTDNEDSQSTSASETIKGDGTINLHKIAKTGKVVDLVQASDDYLYLDCGSSTTNTN